MLRQVVAPHEALLTLAALEALVSCWEQKQSDRLRFNVKKKIQWREYMKKNRLRAKQHSLRKTINIYESFYLLLETELLTNFCIWNEWIYVITGGPESSGTWRTVSSCLQVRVRANWTCRHKSSSDVKTVNCTQLISDGLKGYSGVNSIHGLERSS